MVHERVTLSSGAEADYYVDLRRVTLEHRAAPLVGRLLRVLTADWEYAAVGGLTLGADPVADAVLHAAAAERAADPDIPPVDAFVVRKATKEHGMQRLIEGPDIAGRRVLVVEDTSTTGSSVLTAVRAAREAGATVVGVVTVVDRDTGAREAIEAEDVPYRALLGLADLGLGLSVHPGSYPRGRAGPSRSRRRRPAAPSPRPAAPALAARPPRRRAGSRVTGRRHRLIALSRGSRPEPRGRRPRPGGRPRRLRLRRRLRGLRADGASTRPTDDPHRVDGRVWLARHHRGAVRAVTGPRGALQGAAWRSCPGTSIVTGPSRHRRCPGWPGRTRAPPEESGASSVLRQDAARGVEVTALQALVVQERALQVVAARGGTEEPVADQVAGAHLER